MEPVALDARTAQVPGQRHELGDCRLAAVEARVEARDLRHPRQPLRHRLDGRQVVQEIKQASPETPIIVLTAWATLLDSNDTLLKQAEAVLRKPLSMAQLESVLRRLGASATRPKSHSPVETADTSPEPSNLGFFNSSIGIAAGNTKYQTPNTK